MRHSLLLAAAALVAHGPGAGTALAAGPDPAAEANRKLRETLRNTLVQMRTVETEKATLQAAQAELEQKNKDLEAKIKGLEKKVADLVKQSAADKAAAEKKESEMASSIVTRDQEIARQGESLKKWKEYQAKAEELVKRLSAERASKASEVIVLQRRVEDQQRRNAEMYRIGSDVLSRYQNFGLGTALTAREPFIGATRVKLQNLMQDFADKLADARIKPGQQPAAASAGEGKAGPAAASPGKKP